MEELIVATNNKGKIKEIREILKNIKLYSLDEIGMEIEVEEDEDTFEGNALKKAKEITKLTGKSCIADDSGLCIDALQGFPGVQTKRFLGEVATQEERNTYLMKQLKSIKDRSQRKAQVVTCIALIKQDGEEKIFKGILEGYISEQKRGENGFGFDEIFELEDGKTLAEISSEVKNKISSRNLALMQLKQWLQNQ